MNLKPVSLAVPPSNGAMTFNWPVAASAFTLECSPQLGGNAVWTPLAVVPLLNGSANQVTVPPTNSTMFFRLFR
jgi:hypothetical protein